MKFNIFRLLTGIFFLALAIAPSSLYAQGGSTIQVRTFDQQLQIFPGIDVSIDGKTYFTMNEMGSAIVETVTSNLPPDLILIGDSTLEAESWNYSKGILEIIIRLRTTQTISVLVKDISDNAVSDLTVTYRTVETITVVTDKDGYFEMVVPIEDDLNSPNLFSLEGYILSNMKFIGSKGEFTVEKIPVVVKPTISTVVVQNATAEDIDLSSLDSLTSLPDFYAVIHNLDMNNLDAAQKEKIDVKFLELMGLMTDSLKRGPGIMFGGVITDSSLVEDDLTSLIEQALVAENRIAETRNQFAESITIISEKMGDGGENLDDFERANMAMELDRLTQILAENERNFFKDQEGLQAMLISLKNNLLNIQDLEEQLSISEQQRLEEQQLFQQRLLIAFDRMDTPAEINVLFRTFEY